MQKIYSVHDSAAKAYLPPFFMRTNTEAERAFETTVKDENSQFNKYPGDYTLVSMGTFDEDTGLITATEPQIIANATKFLSNNLIQLAPKKISKKRK